MSSTPSPWGRCAPQAAGLSADQIRAVAVYLTDKEPAPRAAVDANPCAAAAAPALSPHDWRSWGLDLASSRYQPDGGLSAAQVPRLKLRWTFAFPGRAAFGQPAVVGNMVIAGGTGARVFGLDADSGCTYWSYYAGALVRTGIVVGALTAAQSHDHKAHLAAWFGDDSGILHAVDVHDGKPLWTQRLDNHPIARLVGTPQLYSGVLYAPVSSFEEVAAADPNYHCCTFRGSLVAVSAGTGKVLWQSYTIRRPATVATAASGKEVTGTCRRLDLLRAHHRCEARADLCRYRRCVHEPGERLDRCHPRAAPRGWQAHVDAAGAARTTPGSSCARASRWATAPPRSDRTSISPVRRCSCT